MDRVGIVRYPDAVPSQLVPKSYRPGAGGPGRRREHRHALLKLLGPADQRLPDPLARIRVERREDLAAAGVEHGEPFAAIALPHPPPERIERAGAGHGQAEAGTEPAGGGDGDPQPGEGAGAEADGKQVDPLPATGGGSATLDLAEQRGCVPGPPVRGGPQ